MILNQKDSQKASCPEALNYILDLSQEGEVSYFTMKDPTWILYKHLCHVMFDTVLSLCFK